MERVAPGPCGHAAGSWPSCRLKFACSDLGDVFLYRDTVTARLLQIRDCARGESVCLTQRGSGERLTRRTTEKAPRRLQPERWARDCAATSSHSRPSSWIACTSGFTRAA